MIQRNYRGKQLEMYKKSLKLTETQREVLIGTLLGDASMSLRLGKPHYSVKFEQGEKNAEYVNHLYEIFSPFTGTPPKWRYIDKERTRRALWFRTYKCNNFIFYWNLFYRREAEGGWTKKVPRIIHKYLTPRALAYWFMDDGTKTNNNYVLNTQGFEKHECELLCEVLKKNFNIICNVHKDKKQWRIYVRSQSTQVFTELVQPYIIPCFTYKLQHI